MVVEPVEDLDVGVVGQAPLGEVGLPTLVGLVGGEASVGGAVSLPRFGPDEALGVQDAADGGGRGRSLAFLFKVPGDGDRTGVEACLDQPEP